MTQRIWIIHGIHQNDSDTWHKEMQRCLTAEGFDVKIFTYGYAYALLTWFQNPIRARKLAEKLHNGDVVIGHSNGCDIIQRASNLRPFMHLKGAFFFNPALDPDATLGCSFDYVKVIHNSGDVAVKIAKLFPAHPWGEMGAVGYQGISWWKYQNINSFDPGLPLERRYYGHSGFQRSIPAWSRWIAKVINGRFA